MGMAHIVTGTDGALVGCLLIDRVPGAHGALAVGTSRLAGVTTMATTVTPAPCNWKQQDEDRIGSSGKRGNR